MLLCSFFCPRVTAEEITIFFTGNELGQLQPCGCSGGQLGGFDRRYDVFNAAQPKNRLILDTGSLVPDSGEQNLIKFQIIIQAFAQLGYDVVNLTEQDTLVVRQSGLVDGINDLFNCITAAPADDINLPVQFTRRFTLKNGTIDVTIAVIDTGDQLPQVGKLLSRSSKDTAVNILIVNRSDENAIASVSNIAPVLSKVGELIDCLLIPPQTDDPKLLSKPGDSPLIISQGRLGKYVGKIQVAPEVSPAELENYPQKLRLSFSSVTVTEDLPQHQPLVELYRNYQKLLKEADLLENYPRFVLPDNLEYVGSKSCKLCHDYEYEKWMNSPPVILPGVAKAKNRHSNAFDTLEDIGSDYDPECVICHVIGMRYETGFVTPEKTPQLRDVGCENCHGPGSEHVRSLGAVETAGPQSSCIECHNPDHSGDYAANEQQYNEKVVHWRQPKQGTKAK